MFCSDQDIHLRWVQLSLSSLIEDNTDYKTPKEQAGSEGYNKDLESIIMEEAQHLMMSVFPDLEKIQVNQVNHLRC